MSLFDVGKICLFSEVNGQVLLNGKPISNATVKQTYIWGEEPAVKVMKTDEQGRFKFDAVFTRSLAKYMPAEAVISQEIKIEHNGEQYDAWISTKRDFDENSELDGKKINLICELTNEEVSERVGTQMVVGICRWE